MSETLDSLLLNWLNWIAPDGGPISDLKETRASGKLPVIYDRLLPKELRPGPDDPLEFAYTAASCTIKLNNHGPDKFTPPSFSTDEVRNMKMLLMNLFLLFMVVEGDERHFPDGQEPSWFTSLAEKFHKWDKAESGTVEFPLEMMAENFRARADERARDVQRLKEVKAKFDEEVRAKVGRKREAFAAVLAANSNELTQVEMERMRLEHEKEERQKRREEIEAEEHEKEELQRQIDELEREKKRLNGEIQRMKSLEGEMQRIAVDLAGMEQAELLGRCEKERERVKELEDEEKRIDQDFLDMDTSERDELLAEITRLEQQAAETDPDKIRAEWNEKLDAEIAQLQRRNKQMTLVLQLGEYLAAQRK